MAKQSLWSAIKNTFKTTDLSVPRQSVTLARFPLVDVERVCVPRIRKCLRRGDTLLFGAIDGESGLWLMYREAPVGAVPPEEEERIAGMLSQEVPIECRVIGVDPNGDDTSAVRVEIAFLT
ncbi:hypothetical protein [Desulfovibrio inopinatus]|uniref:hypothetical protein n=1 Tax=Desulfovibrio inopinatus TaxID=102109 RepID=UPI000411BF0F|nr:hypothetical protein [Desulfovibrio inopinatus]